MKKFLSVLLVFAMTFSFVSGFVFAADEAVVEEPSAVDKVKDGVCLLLNAKHALVMGEKMTLDVAPFTTESGRTLVPLRFISEAFKAKVDWDGDKNLVTITLGSKKIELTIDSNIIYKNGAAQEIDSPAILKDDRTFVPLRACAEALGKQVFWDDMGLIVVSDKKVTFAGKDEMIDVISAFALPELTGITLDGVMVEGFDPNVFEYSVKLPYGTTAVPAIEATADEGCAVEVKSITSLPGTVEIKASLPSVAGMFNRYKVNVRAVGEIEVSVSNHEDGNGPENARDKDLTTRLAMDGESWVQYDFANPIEISSVFVACWKSDVRHTKLTIQISEDGTNFTTVFDGQTSVTEDVLEEFKLPKKATIKALKILGHGNTSESSASSVWTSILEIDWK